MTDRLAELISDDRGRLSTTEVTTLAALVVSSLVVLICSCRGHEPTAALTVYLGAWVTHAGVQKYHERRAAAAAASTGEPREANTDENGAD